jgi:hypothetical protein
MEHSYTAYTKLIDNKTHFFVKKFQVFPELKTVPPILECYGMHTDFDKCCAIAGINDSAIKKQLLQDIENNAPMAKVIHLMGNLFADEKILAR